MKELKGSALSLAVLLALGACTETQFADSLGVGKSAPNESQVRVNQALSMPPDLLLSPPSSSTVKDDGQLNKVAKVDAVKRPVSAAPAGADDMAADEPVMTASTVPLTQEEAEAAEPVKTAEAAATATTTPTPTEAPPPATKEDAYKRYGISTTYPNGKPKPEGILNEELRKAQLAAKRSTDPKYGSIWNMGDMFGDD